MTPSPASNPETRRDGLGTCAAIVPAWNEAPTIAGVIARLQGRVDGVLVVDDGSTDDTAGQARAAGAEVRSLGSNLGKGAALRAGLAWAGDAGFDWVITLDADGQHAPEEIPALRAHALATGADLVIGNRMDEADRMPWTRRLANRWMSRRLSRRAGRELPDSQCGFRLGRVAAWRRLSLRADRFETESETLLAFLAGGFDVAFVPVSVIAAPRPSRIRPWQDTVRWLRWWREDASRSRRGIGPVAPAWTPKGARA